MISKSAHNQMNMCMTAELNLCQIYRTQQQRLNLVVLEIGSVETALLP